MNEAKRALRTRVRAQRRALDPLGRAAESSAICRACETFADGGDLASYAAMPDEVDLAELHERCWRAGRVVLLPRVLGDGLLAWHALDGAGPLRRGAYGIAEPDPQLCPAIDLPHGATVLVPGVAFTASGLRLGQGGGFYDRLLAARPDLRAIGVGFACQLVDAIPAEPHDRPLSGLIIAGKVVLAPGPT